MIISAQATADFTTRGPTPLNSPGIPSSYTLLAFSANHPVHRLHDAEGRQCLSRAHLLLRLHDVERIHEEGSQRSRRRAANETLRGTREIRLLHDRSRLFQSVCYRKQLPSHQPVKSGEGDVAEQIRVHALPEIEHAVNTCLATHALDRADEAAGHSRMKSKEQSHLACACVLRNSSGSTQTTASARARPPLMAGTIQDTLIISNESETDQWFVK